MKTGRHHARESGFAMLLVFVMAATVAIMLYVEIPSVLFESQRAKEELLIERGEQYRRGIQLYVRKNKRFPPTLDDLDRSGTVRYIRRRYDDPMTGKKEWRIVHTDGNILTDSLVQKAQLNKDGKQEQKSVNTFVTEGPAIGSTGPQQGQGASALWRRQRRGARTRGQSGENPSEDPAAVPDQAQTIAIYDPSEAAGGTAGNASS